MIEAPVLLIVFNRPETTQKVLDAIKKAQPQKLYIAADAPPIGNVEDEKNCPLVKEIVKQVDWDCEVHYRFADVNQGCGPGPYNAISWAFENEDRLIILEDDCVPAQPFFSYCNELLERYKNDTRIWVISGNQFHEEAVKTPHSYFFTRYCTSWGWATWKRCWTAMDLSMAKYPLVIEQDLYKAAFRTKEEVAFFQKSFGIIFHDKTLISHIWDAQWGFTITSNGGLGIVPKKNLVTNIGYLGTHSGTKNRFHDRPVNESYVIESHPDFVLPDVNYDNYQFKHHWNKKASFFKKTTSVFKRIIRKISKVLNGIRS
jgi:hypothetical protein